MGDVRQASLTSSRCLVMNVAVVFHAAGGSEATGLFDVWCEFICFIGTLLLLCFALLRLLFLKGGGLFHRL